MANFYDRLKDVLRKDKRFFSRDGSFLREAVYDAAMNMDANLIKILLEDADTSSRFFTDINGVKVFDKVGFAWLINNQQFLPDSYTRFKNKIGLSYENGNMISSSGDVELVFPYKDCVLEGGQTKEDQKRSEIFYNETLAPDEVDRLLYPKVFTHARRYTGNKIYNGISDFSEDDNLVIKGNNMLVVSSLLSRYENRIKCVYIDPPFNPPSDQNTFSYNNSFKRSTWLVFMKTRLQLAKRLLKKDDGVLIVAIDKNEQPRLQILIEELFPEYDVDCITVVNNPRGEQGTNFSYTHEFAIFVTPKGKKTICNRNLSENEIEWSPLRNWGAESLRTDARNCFYPIIVEGDKIVEFGDVCDDSFHPSAQTVEHDGRYYIYPIDVNGIERKWRYARQSVAEISNLLRVKKTKTGYDIELGKNYGTYKTVWVNPKYDSNAYGKQLLTSIIPDTKFSFPKSLYTVMDCLDAVVRDDKNAIILDFFAGSGTTGHAVMELNKRDNCNRHFILVEQMDYVETDTLVRNVKKMNELCPTSSIAYFELKELNQKYVHEIDWAETEESLQRIYTEMVNSGFISYKIDPSKISNAANEYEALSLDEKKRFLMEILDKNLLYVNYCDIDDAEFEISDVDKEFTKSFYMEK